MLHQLSAHCYALSHNHTADRPALGVVSGSHFTLRIDCGNSPAHDALMRSAMHAVGLPAADLTALTHSHWDHSFGLCAADRPVIANVRTQAILQRMVAWSWTLPAMEQRLVTHEDISFCHDAMLIEYPEPTNIRVRAADITFDGTLSIDLGGVTAQLLCLPSSHTDDCTTVFIPEDGVLYLGDITYEDLHHNPVCLHVRRYRQLMDALRQLDFTIAVPGHQSPRSKQELLDDMTEMLASGEFMLLDD